ncbi:MAG: hypothetical protein K2P17_03995 [Helicobacteraceae bacterium]|nr:hypothetical protein [Helicobacteraceae bacterium]
MATNNKWLEWYNTDEGKAYYNKYLADIPGINDDENTLQNAYYEYVNKIYQTEDSIKETASSIASYGKWLIVGVVLIFAYLNIKQIKSIFKRSK